MPKYLGYYIEVLTNNNGHESPILLARREFDISSTFDIFTTTVSARFLLFTLLARADN